MLTAATSKVKRPRSHGGRGGSVRHGGRLAIIGLRQNVTEGQEAGGKSSKEGRGDTRNCLNFFFQVQTAFYSDKEM